MNRFISRAVSRTVYVCLLAIAGCSSVNDSTTTAPTEAPEAPRVPVDPTAHREPSASKSLVLDPSWQPPTPAKERRAHLKARVQPPARYGVPTPTVSSRPTDGELGALYDFAGWLRPTPGESSVLETEDLAAALREQAKDARHIEPLLRFVAAYPQSRWVPAIRLRAGVATYHAGQFQQAFDQWNAAWELAKNGTDEVSQDIANQALGEYAKMSARVGRMSDVAKAIELSKGRSVGGDARNKIQAAAEGLWTMENHPGVAFRCGPFAVLNVARELHPEVLGKAEAFLAKAQSPKTGFSIPQVERMSAELGLKLQIARRTVGAAVIVPAVAHWKVGHFGALIRELDGSFLLKDPTFGNEIWMKKEVIDEESSGYFLVPAGPLPEGWSKATTNETAHLYGKGYAPDIDDDDDGDDDDGSCPDKGDDGSQMASYYLHILVAGVHIEDTPVGYRAAVGPDVRVKLAYNQREAAQPAEFDFTSFGPHVVSNWISYLVDDTTNPAAEIKLRKIGGGGETHSNFNAATQSFGPQLKSASILYRLTANSYKKTYPDGHQEYYEHYLGTTGTQRRVFLSRIVDPRGNQVSVEYDTTYPARIHQLIDATGLPTVFHYDYPGSPYLVTTIEDPYGRESSFTYTSYGGKVRLQSTTDAFGIVSSFKYGNVDDIVAMTTPYGTTTFKVSDPYINVPVGLFRYVEATDPLGQTERVEFNTDSAVTGVTDALETPYPDSTLVKYSASFNNYRNSFYWNKLQMQLAPGNYQKAHRYHWQHKDSHTTSNVLESEVRPLEGRIFYNYPGSTGATGPTNVGTSGRPIVVGRVVKDAQGNNQTQATKYEYNAQGNVTKVTDPAGRETVTEYAANGVDVVAIKQKTGMSGSTPIYTTTSSFVYGPGAPPHVPTSMTDGAGQTTSFTYTSTGELLTTQNAKGEITTYTYETNPSSAAYGRVLSITGDVPGGNRSYTYDDYGRVHTATDSEGYTLTYAYDSLDRVRLIAYPNGSFEQFEYEDHSLVASRDREGRWTRHMYNGIRRRVLTQDPALRTTQTQWCACGQIRRFVDGNGNITEWLRDEAGRQTKKIQADGTFNAYAYDYSGRLLTETDPMGRTTTYQYAIDDRITKKDYSDTATPDVTYAYDPYFPRVSSRVDGAGTTTFTYHPYGTGTLGAGQVALENGPFTDDTLKRTYDQLGRVKKLEIVDDATHTIASYSEEYTFDSRARVTSVQNNLGTSTYAFVGQSGRPSNVSYPNGMQILYDYYGATGDFLLKQIKNLSAGTPPTVISQFDYTYRPDRAIDQWVVNQGAGPQTWTFGYDGSRQLTSATLRDANQAPLEADTYGYDSAGNRIQVATTSGTPRNYQVNGLNQLVSERGDGRTTFSGFVNEPAAVTVNGKPATITSLDGGAPYKFEALLDLDAGANSVTVQARDGNNNVSTKSYTLTAGGAAQSFEYDANGNLRFEKSSGGTTSHEYRWDQQSRLVRAILGTHDSVYDYNGESKRVRIRELTDGTTTKDETFVWCGSRICQKRNGTTVLRNYFEQGFEEGTNDYFYTRDHLRSVREIVATNGPNVASKLAYSPWGELTETGSGPISDFAFTGHLFDRATGLSLAWRRGYDPILGRWVSMDPIALAGGPNMYAYVSSSPINDLDEFGLQGFRDPKPLPWDVQLCMQLTKYSKARTACCTITCTAAFAPDYDAVGDCMNRCAPPEPEPGTEPRPEPIKKCQ